MILTKVELTNFRSYHGRHVVDLSACTTYPNRRIVAVGGLNGSGKTSFLDAITYTLLGVADAHKYVDDVERKKAGLQQIDRAQAGLLNREALRSGEREARVRLDFLEDDGETFSVERTWSFDARGRFRKEQMLVTIAGRELSNDDEQLQDVLSGRIPPSVLKFFVFDGEKIQDIANDEVGDSVIDGINCLLGFHVLEVLITDMEDLQKQYRQEAQRRNRQEEDLTELKSQETKLSNQVAELDEEKVELEDRVEKLKERSRELTEEHQSLFSGSAGSPKEIQQQLDRATDVIRDCKTQIEDAADRWIIPVIPIDVLQDLDGQLAGEEERAQWEEGMRTVEPRRNLLIEKLLGPEAPPASPPLEDSQIAFLRERICNEWLRLFHPPPPGIAETVIHRYLSSEERAQVRARCGEAMNSGAIDLQATFDRLDSAERTARNLRQQLEQIGDGDRAQAIIEEKAQVDREFGEAEQGWEGITRKINALNIDLQQIRKEITNKEDQLDASGQSGERAAFVRKVKRAIEQYQEALRPRKRDEVAQKLTEMYKLLARKEDVVDRIQLDEKSYRPQLLDRRGNTMPLHTLSAGEREIYALSLLWALGKTSRRALPVVIDTPLARLDSEHRGNIVKRYLPEAGSQVIVLSTDTEIDRQYFELIQEHVATTLRLEFDPRTERTSVLPGYFEFE